jgi:Icc-related predicted phosphoesterase
MGLGRGFTKQMKRLFRIYAVSDIHGNADSLSVVEKNVTELKPDLLIIPGDIAGLFSKNQTLKRLGALDIEIMAVRGNSDIFMSDRDFASFGIIPLHLAQIQKEGFKLVGINGALPLPFHTRIRFNEKALEKKLMGLVDTKTILVAHPPPFGIRDEVLGVLHAGSRLIRNVIDRRKPKMVLCGHIHERAGQSKAGQTLVVNCSFSKFCSGVLIEWDHKGAIVQFRN